MVAAPPPANRVHFGAPPSTPNPATPPSAVERQLPFLSRVKLRSPTPLREVPAAEVEKPVESVGKAPFEQGLSVSQKLRRIRKIKKKQDLAAKNGQPLPNSQGHQPSSQSMPAIRPWEQTEPRAPRPL